MNTLARLARSTVYSAQAVYDSKVETASINDGLRKRRFESLVLPHMARAYNLARWLSRSDNDAADILQEAFMRAFQYFDGYRGGDVRSWLLSIVRNTANTWRRSNPPAVGIMADAAEPLPSSDGRWALDGCAPQDPMQEAVSAEEAAVLRRAIADLPVDQREVLILREFEDLSYQEIAGIVGAPIGTVMSRLSRARDALAARLRAMNGIAT